MTKAFELQYTLRDLEIQVAFDNLKTGMMAAMGGDFIARWVDKNRDKIEHIFCSLDECYIQLKGKNEAAEFAKILEKAGLAKFTCWVKPKNHRSYLLKFRWD